MTLNATVSEHLRPDPGKASFYMGALKGPPGIMDRNPPQGTRYTLPGGGRCQPELQG